MWRGQSLLLWSVSQSKRKKEEGGSEGIPATDRYSIRQVADLRCHWQRSVMALPKINHSPQKLHHTDTNTQISIHHTIHPVLFVCVLAAIPSRIVPVVNLSVKVRYPPAAAQCNPCHPPTSLTDLRPPQRQTMDASHVSRLHLSKVEIAAPPYSLGNSLEHAALFWACVRAQIHWGFTTSSSQMEPLRQIRLSVGLAGVARRYDAVPSLSLSRLLVRFSSGRPVTSCPGIASKREKGKGTQKKDKDTLSISGCCCKRTLC